jgi:signal transduction histidine kinase
MKTNKKINHFSIPFEIWLPIIYLIVGGMWILFSDKLLLNIVNGDLERLARLQTIKGWFYVFATAILLFLLLWNNNKRRKRYIKLINAARKNLERANKLKANFLANLSHELRTPMNAINGFTDLIRQYVVNPEESRQYHAIVKENTLKLLRMIENIVDMSKIQVNLLELKASIFSVSELIEALKRNTESMIPEEKLMHFVKSPDENIVLQTDFNRLLQVCEILVMNSISNPGKGMLVMSFHAVEDKYSISIYWEKSLAETETQINTGETGIILPESIGWEIASGLIKLLHGKISVHKLNDKTYRFLLIIPQTIPIHETEF